MSSDIVVARTLLDLIEAGEAEPYASRIVYPTGSHVPHFRCRCGRLVPADMMLDLNPGPCGGICGHVRGRDRLRCDACWRRWVARREVGEDEIALHAERYSVRRAADGSSVGGEHEEGDSLEVPTVEPDE